MTYDSCFSCDSDKVFTYRGEPEREKKPSRVQISSFIDDCLKKTMGGTKTINLNTMNFLASKNKIVAKNISDKKPSFPFPFFKKTL